MTSNEFWVKHQVGGPYTTLEESEDALERRLKLYPRLHELMPVNLPGKVVLDYGCGPGHDVILFARNGAKRVLYYDVSPIALEGVPARLALHGLSARFYEGEFVDHVHCAGVLHHLRKPLEVLQFFRSILRPGCEARIMAYDGDVSEMSQSDVPITHWWTAAEFTDMANNAGFVAEFVGRYDCSSPWRPNCFAACWRLI